MLLSEEKPFTELCSTGVFRRCFAAICWTNTALNQHPLMLFIFLN